MSDQAQFSTCVKHCADRKTNSGVSFAGRGHLKTLSEYFVCKIQLRNFATLLDREEAKKLFIVLRSLVLETSHFFLWRT
jgi:hypothetical protein